MSLRREQNAELERVYNDFMNYYQKKVMQPKHNKKPMILPYPCYDKDWDDEYYHKKHHHKEHMEMPMKMPMHHPYHNMPHHTLPYEPPYHTLPYEFPYTILPYPTYPKVPYSQLNQKRVLDDTSEYTIRQSERASKVLEPAAVCDKNETFPMVYTPEITRLDNSKTVEQKYYKALFSNLSKSLQPYVSQVIKNNNYIGSPINDKYFDRETLAQLVQEVLDRAKNNPQLIKFIQNLDPEVREIMKNLVEALVLGELFVIHRPNTNLNEENMINTMPYNSQNARYNNMYGDPKNSKPLDENMDNYLCEPCNEMKNVANPKNLDNKSMMETYENKVSYKSKSPLFGEIQSFSN